MSVNSLNDISKVYLEQVASIDEARSIEHMRDRYLKDPKEIAKSRAKNITDRKKKRAALAHMEKQYAGMKAGIYSSYEPDGEMVDEAKKEKPKRWWDDDGDDIGYEKGEVSGKFKRKKVKEGFSNWRQDLSEVMDDAEANQKIKEKKVNNKIKINPKLGEAVEEIGGTLLEMVEIDEVDYIVESVYDELLEEGYEEDDIEEALEYALIEAKVTFGHDTDKPYQKKTGAGQMVRAVGRLARQKLASKVTGARKSVSAAVARGARKVAKGALGVARKMEGGDKKPKTTERKPSTYRGAGAGTKERVSSGSYTPPNRKKSAKPADPWEGSYKKSSEVETKAPKSKPKSAVKSKPSTTQKGKKKSKLDDLLTSIRNEETVIDEKMNLAKAKMGDVIKDFYKSKAPQFKGASKEKRRQMAVAAKLTAERGGKKLGEQMLDEPSNDLSNKKELLDKQKISNLKMLQQKKQMMDRQRLQMQKTGKLPLDTASYEPEGEVIDERRKEDKVAGTPRKPRNLAFELVAKSMGTGRMGVKPRGEKKVPGKKPPAAGEYGATASPAQKVAKRRAARKSAQDNMSSRFD